MIMPLLIRAYSRAYGLNRTYNRSTGGKLTYLGIYRVSYNQVVELGYKYC